ncbi:unnamed protein product [Cuscuta europaea]|uniref:Uncharacterized protein n=1 Tax=Cuscuta europaea TaxID=41803 RepID=A0A9P0ZVY5_CUSEU|nr:unnamed protein product [Cuscuta europaea]
MINVGTLQINRRYTRILIDTGAQRSFVSESFTKGFNEPLVPMTQTLLVSTPLGDDIERDSHYPSCEVEVEGQTLTCDFAPLGMIEFNAILRMDWGEKHHAKVDCYTKVFKLESGEGLILHFEGDMGKATSCIISVVRARKMMKK